MSATEPSDSLATPQDPRQRLRLIIAIVVVLFVITAATALIVGTVSPPGVPSHVVGQYSGMPIDEVRAATETNAWVLDEDQVRSDTVRFGSVISQSPAPGTLLEEGELLTVDVSSGPLLVVLPQVVGLTTSEAVSQLEDSGFVVGLIAPRFDATVPKDRAIEVTPDGGSRPPDEQGEQDGGYERGTVVTLIVSAGAGQQSTPGS